MAVVDGGTVTADSDPCDVKSPNLQTLGLKIGIESTDSHLRQDKISRLHCPATLPRALPRALPRNTVYSSFLPPHELHCPVHCPATPSTVLSYRPTNVSC